jgi:DNA-binding transcriptional LysR family regulator
MDSEAACNAVANGEIELGIVTLPTIARAPLRAQPVWDDPLEFVVGRNHPLAARRQVSRKELLAEPAILPGSGTITRRIVLRALGVSEQAVTVGMSTNYLEVLRMLTATGLGWSCLPRTLIDDALKVIQIEKVRVRRTLGIVTHEGRTLSNAARALIDVVRSSA